MEFRYGSWKMGIASLFMFLRIFLFHGGGRKLKEAWMIERIEKSNANRDNGRTLPESYKILF